MREFTFVAVTISRQMGSGGAYLGYLAAQQLGFKYVDREILQRAARELGTDVEGLERIEEKPSSLIETIMKGFSFGAPETVSSTGGPVYDKDLFARESRIMNDIADGCDAVFIGRAGFHALRNRPRVLRVFTCAPLEFRIDRVMQAQKVSRSRAEALIADSDRKRAGFVRDMAGVNWLDARNYHLCIDTGTVGFESGAAIIADIVRSKWGRGVKK